MSKRKHRIPVSIESGQDASNLNGSSNEIQIRVDMPVRRVVSEDATSTDVDRETEDQELPHTVSMSSNVEPSASNNISDMYRPCVKRVSVQQLEFLARCMERFPALALSRAKGREALEHSQRKWRQIAAALNNIYPQVSKTERGWLRYWADLKFKVRRKYAFSRRFDAGGRSVQLSPFERRLIRILTDEDGNLLCSGSTWQESHASRDQEVEEYSRNEEEPKPVPTEQVNVDSGPSVPPVNIEEDTVQSSCSLTEDPIGIGKKGLEELQTDILQFKLKKQKEMHEVEISQMKERHRLEMEILELKKKILIQEFDRRKKFRSSERTRRGARSMN